MSFQSLKNPQTLPCLKVHGAGPIGLLVANAWLELCLQEQKKNQKQAKIHLILKDIQPLQINQENLQPIYNRTLALNYGTWTIFKELGVNYENSVYFKEKTHDIHQVNIQYQGLKSQTVFSSNSFDVNSEVSFNTKNTKNTKDINDEPHFLGKTIAYVDLCALLYESLQTKIAQLPQNSVILDIPQNELEQEKVKGEIPQELTLINVFAFGNIPDSQITDWALLANITYEKFIPHHAWERFLQRPFAGSFALLPNNHKGYKLILCGEFVKKFQFQSQSEALIQFIQEQGGNNQHEINHLLGKVIKLENVKIFPIKTGERLHQPINQHHDFYLGNSAQMLHPIAAQGFNLGVRDVQTFIHNFEKTNGFQTISLNDLRKKDRQKITLLSRFLSHNIHKIPTFCNIFKDFGLKCLNRRHFIHHRLKKRMMGIMS